MVDKADAKEEFLNCLSKLRYSGRTYGNDNTTLKFFDTARNLFFDLQVPEEITDHSIESKEDKVRELVQRGIVTINYLNKDCKSNCTKAEIIASSMVRSSPLCGEGEYTRLWKCYDCGSLYMKNCYTDMDEGAPTLHHASRLKGNYDEGELVRIIKQHTGSITDTEMGKARR